MLFLAAAILLPLAADGGDRHLFILSGQSNMAGLDPKRSFLPELEKLLPDAEIRHVKFAKGGMPIRRWVSDFDEILLAMHGEQLKERGFTGFNDPAPFYDEVVKLAREAIAEKKPDTITFLWMQGERDANAGLHTVYDVALRNLIAKLRKDLDAPEMNVVIGRLSDHSAKPSWSGVRQAQVKVAAEDPRGAWVDTDDTNNKVKDGKPHNDLHYTREGYDLFGRRLARQAVRLIEGKEPAANGRP
ncbi:MAG: acetyl xylan esterase [Akkermansiaceae bacterium]|nr:acetyl xylan esterase [Akkermansiaceae bacterium]